jgi:hypothetical protein
MLFTKTVYELLNNELHQLFLSNLTEVEQRFLSHKNNNSIKNPKIAIVYDLFWIIYRENNEINEFIRNNEISDAHLQTTLLKIFKNYFN